MQDISHVRGVYLKVHLISAELTAGKKGTLFSNSVATDTGEPDELRMKRRYLNTFPLVLTDLTYSVRV